MSCRCNQSTCYDWDSQSGQLDQGRSVDVTVVDLCPGCQSGHIDLSQGAFQQLADLGLGVLNGVEYHYL